MKRFNFPFAYEPKLNLKNTIEYSSLFKSELIRYFHDKYKAIYLDPAFIVSNKNSEIAYMHRDRMISFDNRVNNIIFSFNSAQDNYLMSMSNIFRTDNLMTFAPYIRRDATQTNLDSIINWELDLELSMPIHLNMSYFVTLAREIYLAVANITKQIGLQKIYKVSHKKNSSHTFTIVDAQKIESLYPTLSLEEAFNYFCSENKYVIVRNNIKRLLSGKSINSSIPTAQDSDLSCALYVYDDINSKPIQLINVCKRPDGKTSFEQLKKANPLELSDAIYSETIFNEKRPTNISVVINYTNFLYYFLDKIHLAEVVKSVWPDDFLNFIEKEKIEIM